MSKKNPLPEYFIYRPYSGSSNRSCLPFLLPGKNTTSVAIIYILAVVFISRYTDGYVPGIISLCGSDLV